MAVTAEGVETVNQRDVLKALGCDNAQGSLFGSPATFERLVESMLGRKPSKMMVA
jgi:EAL domain-containing protein (putative c-di-GMP-specific phosphodiesterase class I)